MQRIPPAVATAPATRRFAVRSAESRLLIVKLYYFFFFASLGPLVSFFNVYLESRGLSGQQIGLVGTIAPLVALIANPFWGSVADRWQIHRVVLLLCALVTGVIAAGLTAADHFGLLISLVVLLFFFRAPMPTLADAATMNTVRRLGGSYGRQRLWGSVGFVLMSYGLGQWIAVDNLEVIFWLHAGMIGLICAGLGLLMPVERRADRVNLLAGLRALSRRPGYLSFLLAMVLAGMAFSGNANFYSMYLKEMGGTERQIGLGWALHALLEIPIMYMGARWFARYGNGRLIVLGFFGFAATWLAMASASAPLPMLSLTPLMGIFYAIFWMAVVGYAAEAAPDGLGATSQGLMSAALGGLGWGLGALLAGNLWDLHGGAAVYTSSAAIIGVAALVFWWGNRRLT